jgi:hypothetical protein
MAGWFAYRDHALEALDATMKLAGPDTKNSSRATEQSSIERISSRTATYRFVAMVYSELMRGGK